MPPPILKPSSEIDNKRLAKNAVGTNMLTTSTDALITRRTPL